MLKKAKEVVVSANSRTKGILAIACIYLIVMLTTVSSGAIDHIIDYIPTVDITVKDGVEEEKGYLVKQDTVENVLDELSITLNTGDTVDKDLNYIVQQNDSLRITRMETKTITVEEKIPFTTITKGSGGWTRTVTQQGEDGIVKKTYLVTYANKKEISRKVVKEEIIKAPVPKIITHGGIKVGTTFSGRLTTYGGDCTGCGGGSSSGVKLSATTGVNNTNSPYLTYKGKKYYCLAADRSIPFGTVIKITNHRLNLPGTIYGIVVDRGGAIKGNKIDIFKGSERGGKQYFTGPTSNNAKFEIVSVGPGGWNFWKK